MFVGSKLLYELYNCKSAQQDADDRDEELDPEESLNQPGVWIPSVCVFKS